MRNSAPGRKEVVAGYAVEARKIPEYFTPEFWHNLRIWDMVQSYGLPYQKGWVQHPARLMQLLQIFDAAKAKVVAEHGDK